MAVSRRQLGINLVFAMVFALGAAVQYNDPDPLQWICIYLAAALSSVAWGRIRRIWAMAALVAAAALVWAVWIGFEMSEWVRPDHMFEPMESRGGAVEQSRELWGLALIAGWMLWLAILGRRQEGAEAPK